MVECYVKSETKRKLPSNDCLLCGFFDGFMNKSWGIPTNNDSEVTSELTLKPVQIYQHFHDHYHILSKRTVCAAAK